jgi:CheY-like chemotaxis protein
MNPRNPSVIVPRYNRRMNKQTIYIVDDESTIREVVRRYLELDGFAVVEAESGTQALDLLRDQPADLILLDIMLPGLDGFAVTRSLRHSPDYAALSLNGDIPIIMLTSRGDEADRIAGFELGVDDYVVKPFSPRELVARVKAVLRRAAPVPPKDEKPITFGSFHIDPLRQLSYRPAKPHADSWRTGCSPHRQGIRPAVVLRPPPASGAHPRTATQSSVGLRILRRREHRHRSHPSSARKNRDRPRRARLHPDRLGRRLQIRANVVDELTDIDVPTRFPIFVFLPSPCMERGRG